MSKGFKRVQGIPEELRVVSVFFFFQGVSRGLNAASRDLRGSGGYSGTKGFFRRFPRHFRIYHGVPEDLRAI